MPGEKQKLSRAVKAPAVLSASNVNAVFAGLMKIEALNRLEQAAFAERLPEAFLQPSPKLVAAYKSLSLPTLPHATTG